MATYKVLQDIEAEDKLLGPLTLRQCIYAAVAVVSCYLSFLCLTKGAAFMILFFLPFIVFGLFFAWPWGKEQSTEVWALARVRFALKPRKRIWDQSGMKDVVTVTAPKTLEDPRINKMSENEVRSRLQALADTIDSRGWATKNAPIGMYASPIAYSSSDRLIDGNGMPQEVADFKTTENDDMFDLTNNPLAQQFEQKINASSSAHRQQLVQQLNNPAPVQTIPAPATQEQNYWYMQQPVPQQQAPVTVPAAMPVQQAVKAPVIPAIPTPIATTPDGIPVAVAPTPEEEALAMEIKRKQEILNTQASSYGHLHTVLPLSQQPVAPPVVEPAVPVQPMAQQNPTPPVTATPDPAILDLANNNDLDIATIAREAQHRKEEAANEVVITLH
jgi:hypothetical protein